MDDASLIKCLDSGYEYTKKVKRRIKKKHNFGRYWC